MLWNELEGQKHLKIVRSGRVSKAEDAPFAYKVQVKEAPSDGVSLEVRTIFDELWGGSLFFGCESASILLAWQAQEVEAREASVDAAKACVDTTGQTKRERALASSLDAIA